jgi:hypothetical protein
MTDLSEVVLGGLLVVDTLDLNKRLVGPRVPLSSLVTKDSAF